VERIVRLLQPGDGVTADPGGAPLVEQVLEVATQHMDPLSAETASLFSAEISAEVPLSLTAGQRP
jgi:hypothetical protein